MTELIRLETLADAPNFNTAVLGKVESFIGCRVLEVGVGIGTFTERLLPRCQLVVGVDVVGDFLALCRKRLGDHQNLELHQADMGAGIPPALRGRRFDTVLCMNVLEHIEDDTRALRDFLALLEPAGALVLIIPQYPWLYNCLDSNDGHFRRYDRRGIEARLQVTGFEVTHTSCFNLAGIVGWFVNGTLLRRKDLPARQLRTYDRLAPWLLRLESLIGPPAGLSLLVVARPRPTY
jgi:SAM-dependent methyltransferase